MNDAQARARWALLFGNFVIGTGVLAPAGLINEIGGAFSVAVPTAGSLIGYGAIFTPQAASAIGLFIAPEHRAGSVAFIFLGWSVALAIGVPRSVCLARTSAGRRHIWCSQVRAQSPRSECLRPCPADS